MKKCIAILVLAMSIIACGLGTRSPAEIASETQNAAIATKASWTATPTMVPTLDYSATIGVTGAILYAGPGEGYPQIVFLFGDLTIIGQAYGCAWFKVVSKTNPSDVGWVGADKVSFSIKCSDVKAVDIPPTPVPTATTKPRPTPTATQKPAPVAPPSNNVTCLVNSNIIISNRSGAPFTLVLTGPGNFTFYLDASEYTTVKVCSGSYNYTVYGTCNGSPATGSGRISDGDQVYFACS